MPARDKDVNAVALNEVGALCKPMARMERESSTTAVAFVARAFVGNWIASNWSVTPLADRVMAAECMSGPFSLRERQEGPSADEASTGGCGGGFAIRSCRPLQ